ncbi:MULTISPECIES: hypothetical protein [Bradyrhizobium]|jgi:hypothetical protein|uniref:hypothetical protein n=1 Tax=Bradyrhizobium TaxID=374 RepID=UPI0003A11A8A|nr:hypothetical protein [Bradyrhizobium denitrificans]MCL8489370.1 hypothetical protein [Bradyrhizobium denitrificans]
MSSAKTHAVIARYTELTLLGLNNKAARGDASAKAESLKLRQALDLYHNQGRAFGEALSISGLNAQAYVQDATDWLRGRGAI